MAKKKYQVFISSTFTDMRAERQAAVEAVLLADHIPAGMELFSAGDKSQLDVIRKWIRDSDIFMLILGGRYGSIEPDSGLSYIELEYNYAQSLNKPFFAVVLSGSALERKAKSSSDVFEKDNRTKYDAFKQRVLGKISSLVDDEKDIKLYAFKAISDAIENNKLAGWVRESEAVNIQPLVDQIEQLSTSNSELRDEVERLDALAGQSTAIENIAGLDDKFRVNVTCDRHSWRETGRVTWDTTWGAIFSMIAPRLISHPNDAQVKDYLSNEVVKATGINDGYQEYIDEQDFQSIKIQLQALRLVQVDFAKPAAGSGTLTWKLTEFGTAKMYELRVARK